MRWPEFRKKEISEQSEKVLRLLNITDHPALTTSFEKELAMRAFAGDLNRVEAQAFILAKIEKWDAIREFEKPYRQLYDHISGRNVH